ncbi:MAG: NUDIX domain-containing protein [Nitrososphaerota archaeon]|nr:NUDIX domain-containing protein [Nitrososphaerota archaeon]
MGGSEPVDRVDENDSIVGSSTVGECVERGLIHRAVAVVVERPGGKILLQRRSTRDNWQPGMWTLSCTGHVRKGETYEAAANRELMEELGITAELAFLKKYLLPPIVEGSRTEHEWVALFAGASGAEVRIDPVELDSVKEFTPRELQSEMDGALITPDAVMLLREYRKFARPTG